MSDNMPYDRGTDVDDDVREAGDDVARAGDSEGDTAGDAAGRTKDGAEGVGRKVSDAVEDVIPGDSEFPATQTGTATRHLWSEALNGLPTQFVRTRLPERSKRQKKSGNWRFEFNNRVCHPA